MPRPRPTPRSRPENTAADIIRVHIQQNITKYKACSPEEVSYRVRKALPDISRGNIRQVVRRLRLSGVLPEAPSDLRVVDSLRKVRAEFGEEHLMDTVHRIVRQLKEMGVKEGDITTEVICTALPKGITLDRRSVREVLSDLRGKGKLSPNSPEAVATIRKNIRRKAVRTIRERALKMPGSLGHRAARIRVFIEELLDLGADPDIFTIKNVFSKLRGDVKGITQNDVYYVLKKLEEEGVLPELSTKGKILDAPIAPMRKLIADHIAGNHEHYRNVPPERLVFEINTALSKSNITVGRLDVAAVVRYLRRRRLLPSLLPERYGEYISYWASLGQKALAARLKETEKVWEQVSRKNK